MKLLYIFLIFSSISIFSEEEDFFESEQFKAMEARYCGPPKFSQKNQLHELKKELGKGRSANIKKIHRLYASFIKKNKEFSPSFTDDNYLVYDKFNFNRLTNQEKELFKNILLTSHICNSLNDIHINEEGNCKIKMALPQVSFSQDEYLEKKNSCFETIELYAFCSAITCAGSLLNASSVSGCLLAIEALKVQAKSLCECDPDNWIEITGSLREFSTNMKEYDYE